MAITTEVRIMRTLLIPAPLGAFIFVGAELQSENRLRKYTRKDGVEISDYLLDRYTNHGRFLAVVVTKNIQYGRSPLLSRL